MKRPLPIKAMIAQAVQRKEFDLLEQQVALFPYLAIPVMFNHHDANRPFEALSVLKQVGGHIGTDKLPASMLAFVFEDILPRARTHEDWQEKLKTTFATLPPSALELLRERLPETENEDMLSLLPKRSANERRRMH